MAVESRHGPHQTTTSSSNVGAAATGSAPRKSKSRSPASIHRSPKASSSSGYPTPSAANPSSSAQHYFPHHHQLPIQHQRHSHAIHHAIHPQHSSAIDHPTDGSPLEESVMSNPAYKVYAELIANSGLASPNAHSTPEASHGSPSIPHASKPSSAAIGQGQQRDDQQHDQDDHQQQQQHQLQDPSGQQMLQHVSTPPGGVMPFPTPGSVPVAYFAGPGGSIIAIPQLKTKRRQVKNACTNCQKACKKCDEVRPCTRCVKYDLASDCVDSQRKERKKGIKRGPYKKREHKTEEEESQGHIAAAAAANAAAQISILTPDNAAAIQAMGGIIYSYAPVHNTPGSGQNPHQSASGSGGESSNSVAGPSSAGGPQDGPSQMSLPVVPPPAGTAASYAFHPQFYLAPGNPNDGNMAHAGPSQGQSQDGSPQQQHAQYYATFAAYFGGSGSVPGTGSGVGPGVGMLLPSMGSVPMPNHGGDGSPVASPSSASQNQQSMYQMQMSQSTMAAADDPIERHHPHPHPQQMLAAPMIMVPQQQLQPQQTASTSSPSGRGSTPGKKAKSEKRKRDKMDDGNAQGEGQQPEGGGSSSSDEQRQAVRQRQAVTVE